MTCANRSFIEYQNRLLEAPIESITLYGLSRPLQESPAACSLYNDMVPMVPAAGLVCGAPSDQLPQSSMQIPEAKRLVYDSAKLARLDTLLQELKAGDHRVLIYFQMTRMMDLMEEYLIYRQYKYLRLDGSSKLEDRRDMVMDWQTRCVYRTLFFRRLTLAPQTGHIRVLAQHARWWPRHQPNCCGHCNILRP